MVEDQLQVEVVAAAVVAVQDMAAVVVQALQDKEIMVVVELDNLVQCLVTMVVAVVELALLVLMEQIQPHQQSALVEMVEWG